MQKRVVFDFCTKKIAWILVCAFCTMLSMQSYGQDRTKLEQDKKQLEAEIKKLNEELQKTKQSKKLSTQQLNVLKKKISEREKLIGNINTQVGILSSQIDSTQQNINVLHSEITDLKLEYAQIIRMLYKQRGLNSQLALIFSAQDFNQAYQRLKYFKVYSEYKKMQAAEIQKKEDQLALVGSALEKQKIEQTHLLAQEQQQRTKLTTEQQQTTKSLSQIQADEKKLASQLNTKREQARKLQEQIKQQIAEEVRKKQEEARKKAEAAKKATKATAKKASSSTASTSKPSAGSASSTAEKPTVVPKEKYTMAATPEEIALSNNFIENKGKLPWPTTKAAIILPYGEYIHAESKGKNFNNGITFATDNGSSVRSVLGGTVVSVFTGPNGQHAIIISHGEFMTVYTNLETISVKKGEKITAKQTIGTIHAIAGEKRAEMNFQIWKASASQNPAVWLAPL